MLEKTFWSIRVAVNDFSSYGRKRGKTTFISIICRKNAYFVFFFIIIYCPFCFSGNINIMFCLTTILLFRDTCIQQVFALQNYRASINSRLQLIEAAMTSGFSILSIRTFASQLHVLHIKCSFALQC